MRSMEERVGPIRARTHLVEFVTGTSAVVEAERGRLSVRYEGGVHDTSEAAVKDAGEGFARAVREEIGYTGPVIFLRPLPPECAARTTMRHHTRLRGIESPDELAANTALLTEAVRIAEAHGLDCDAENDDGEGIELVFVGERVEDVVAAYAAMTDRGIYPSTIETITTADLKYASSRVDIVVVPGPLLPAGAEEGTKTHD